MPIDENVINELLIVKSSYLYHRESRELEYKEQFNLAGLANYVRDFAAFANNVGGYIIFGVKDSPRYPVGLSASALDQFSKIDPERISGYLLNTFSSEIIWDQAIVENNNKRFGVFRIYEARMKPVIAKKDEGKDQLIRNGDIYYRYGGRTQKIQYAELESIISNRIDQNNRQWQDLVKKIGNAGPQNAVILDTEKSLIEMNDSRIMILDDDLANNLKFIKEGQFQEEAGSETLKLVGEVIPVSQVEVIKKIKENLIKQYPLSAMELAAEVKKRIPSVSRNDIWQAIKDNNLKSNPNYSAYNFRNKKQEDHYKDTGLLPSSVPSIYNEKAVEFLVKIFKNSV